MILRALYDYYHRRGETVAQGWGSERITFVILIERDGTLVGMMDTRKDDKTPKSFVVVKSNGRTSAPLPNILWDNAEYVLGLSKDMIKALHHAADAGMPCPVETDAKVACKHRLFVEKVNELAGKYPGNESFRAVALFYDRQQHKSLPEDPLWKELARKPTVNLSFQVRGHDEIVAQDADLQDYVASMSHRGDGDADLPVCLVTGRKALPAEVTSSTPIYQSKATAKLVAFQVNSGYDSYGNRQGLNAPISREAESAYTNALKHLLDRRSGNNFIVGNRTFLFWASSDDEASRSTESAVRFTFTFDDGGDGPQDDPDRGTSLVEKLLKSVYDGRTAYLDTDRFYMLGLAPNSARIAVVYWQELPLKQLAGSMLVHLDDMEIIRPHYDRVRPYKGLGQMLKSIALNGKQENIPPRLPESVISAMLDRRRPYPDTFYQACLRRIRATGEVGVTRAGILKAYINRKNRITNNNKQNLSIMLDRNNKDIGYLCGRLFAVLERCQSLSGGDTLRERYMSSASSTPAMVFPTLLNLSVHHVEKLNEGMKITMEREKGEIIDMFPDGCFPAHLDLMGQGRFFVGYYQQRCSFFTSKKSAAGDAAPGTPADDSPDRELQH